MTQGRKTGGKDWKPGQSGNPNGRPAMPKEVREAMKINKELFAATLTKYLGMTLDQLNKAKADKKTPAMDRLAISIIVRGIKDGDPKRLDFLMNRIIGKVKDELKVEGDTHSAIMDLIRRKKAKEEAE